MFQSVNRAISGINRHFISLVTVAEHWWWLHRGQQSERHVGCRGCTDPAVGADMQLRFHPAEAIESGVMPTSPTAAMAPQDEETRWFMKNVCELWKASLPQSSTSQLCLTPLSDEAMDVIFSYYTDLL